MDLWTTLFGYEINMNKKYRYTLFIDLYKKVMKLKLKSKISTNRRYCYNCG